MGPCPALGCLLSVPANRLHRPPEASSRHRRLPYLVCPPTQEAELKSNGEGISHDAAGEPWLVLRTLTDTQGQAIGGVKVDICEGNNLVVISLIIYPP